ncbi:FMN reductase, partial [Candidatus Saccharibacteria bacterium]|nr:FMN reductase [Candidatus Saccharibacteria bacterium]
ILKNALDCLGSDNFRGKKVGLVSNASNIRKAHQACLHLVTIVQTLYGQPTQTQIGTAREDYEDKDDYFELVNQDIQQRCERLVDELLT